MKKKRDCKVRLIFHPTAPWLWQVMQDQVIVWDLTTEKVCYSCAEIYVGMANDGRTFLTLDSAIQGYAWETVTGQKIPIAHLHSVDYEFHQRAVVLPCSDTNSSTVEITDLFGEYRPQLIDVGGRSEWNKGFLDDWVLLPQRRLAAILWAVGGFDHSEGKVYDLNTDENIGTFWVHRPGSEIVPIEQLDLFVSTSRLAGDVHFLENFSTESPTEPSRHHPSRRWRYRTAEGDAKSISIHPQNHSEFAVVIKRTGFYDEIHLCKFDVQKPDDQQDIEQILPETGTVLALTHHPEGRQLATLLDDGEIHLWDIENATLQKVLSQYPSGRSNRQPLPNEHEIKKNWQRAKQRPRNILHPTKSLRWCEKDEQVEARDSTTGDLCYTVPGQWVGHSQTGDSFLTLIEGNGHAWESENGVEIPLETVDATGYDLTQRLVFTLRAEPAALYVWDLINVENAKTFRPNEWAYILENGGIDPSGERIFLVIIGEDEHAGVEFHDWATGGYLSWSPRKAWEEEVYFPLP